MTSDQDRHLPPGTLVTTRADGHIDGWSRGTPIGVWRVLSNDDHGALLTLGPEDPRARAYLAAIKSIGPLMGDWSCIKRNADAVTRAVAATLAAGRRQ